MVLAVTQELLDEKGLAVSPAQFEELVVAVVHELPSVRRAPRARPQPTAAQAAVLRRGGLDPAPRDHGVDDPYTRGRATYAGLVATAWTAGEAARRLGVSDARIRQRLEERSLYGVKRGNAWRVPTFQFTEDGAEIPGLATVMRALDPALNPVTVYRWFTLPSPDLAMEGEELSPRDWLLRGGSPENVAAIAAVL